MDRPMNIYKQKNKHEQNMNIINTLSLVSPSTWTNNLVLILTGHKVTGHGMSYMAHGFRVGF